jgi:hypothetical protein
MENDNFTLDRKSISTYKPSRSASLKCKSEAEVCPRAVIESLLHISINGSWILNTETQPKPILLVAALHRNPGFMFLHQGMMVIAYASEANMSDALSG